MPSETTPIRISAVKYVQWVQDMNRAIAFYAKVLGLQEVFASPGWTELCWGDAIIALHGGGDSEDKQTGLSIQVDDLDAACQHVTAHGGLIVEPPVARPGEPIRLAVIKDTEGNRLMMTQHVG